MAGYLSSMPSMFSTMPSTGFSQGGMIKFSLTTIKFSALFSLAVTAQRRMLSFRISN